MPYNYKTEIQRYRKYYQSIEPIIKKVSNKSYSSVIFSFLAITLFAWYAIRPTIQTILHLRREITDKTEVNKQMEDKISALIEAQAYYQEIEPMLPLVSQALPPQSDALPLVIQLRNLASQSGVTLTTVQLPNVPLVNEKKPKKKDDTVKIEQSVTQQEYSFSVILSGPYSGIRSYIEGLGNMRRIIAIDGITIAPERQQRSASPSGQTGERMLVLSMRLRTYYVIE